jgi:hypothetical protein
MVIKQLSDEGRTFTSIKNTERQSKKNSTSINIGKFFSDLTKPRNLLLMILALQIAITYIVFNPINIINQYNTVQVMNRVSAKSAVPPQELPVIAMIGDMKTLPKHAELITNNQINATVYSEAKDGDYVLGYSTKMIIYRFSEDKIVYDGDSPVQINQKTQTSILNLLVAKAKEQGLIAQDSTEIPSASIVTDAAPVRASSPSFYQRVQNEDIVGFFNSSSKVIVVRASTGEVINSGTISTIIN